MYLDKIICNIRNSNKVSKKQIKTSKIIKNNFSYQINSKKLVVIIPHWGGKISYNFLVKKELKRKGISTLEYEFPEEILSSNYKLTLNNFKFIQKSIINKISKLKIQYDFKDIKIISISIGCVIACMCANNNKNINKITLIVPGHCLAEAMWNGIATQKLKELYEKQNISLKQLKKYWTSLAPENNIDNLKSNKITIFLGRNDKIIPFYSGEKLLEKMKQLKYNISYNIYKNSGHYQIVINFFLKPKKFLSQNITKKQL